VPRLQAFPGVSKGWINLIAALGNGAVADAIKEGADFMKDAILDSPTNDVRGWHLRKNSANGFASGARIGNTDPSVGDIDPNSGNMLNAVISSGPKKSGSGTVIQGSYGWVDAREEYFIKQDTGAYGVGARIGMGLLNEKTPGSKGVLRDYGAAVAARESLVKSLKASGLKMTGGLS
jgi:hypothetical protein